MNIANQFRKNSVDVNKRKSHLSLTKTLAEKKKKNELLAKQARKKKILEEKEKEKIRLEKLRSINEIKDNKIIKKFLEKSLFEAWKGEVQIIIDKREVKNSHLLLNYGIDLLSTEELVSQINLKIDDINYLISDLKENIREIFHLSLAEGNTLNFTPERLLNESFNFDQKTKFLHLKIKDFNSNTSYQIKKLEHVYRYENPNISFAESQVSIYAELLNRLANPFERHYEKFESKYVSALSKNPNGFGDRIYALQIAKIIFSEIGLTLPSLEDLKADLTNPFYLGDSHIDGLGRYMAFFRVMGGENPFRAIANNIKEKFAIENANNILAKKYELEELSKKIQILELKKIFPNEQNKLLTKIRLINLKIKDLRKLIIKNNYSIPYNSNYFETEFLYDLRKIKTYPKGNEKTNETVDEIKALIMNGGSSYNKLIKVIKVASLEGLYSLTFKIEDHLNKLILYQNNRSFLKILISADSFLKLLLKCGFSYSIKETRSYTMLTIKW